MPTIAKYGSWKSPITPDLIVANTIGVGTPIPDGEMLYWLEFRPSEQGRNTIARRAPDGTVTDLLPLPLNARTRVHEYGGSSYQVHEGTVFFANFQDQRLYRLDDGQEPRPLTPAQDLRYADMVADAERGRLIGVREDHRDSGREAVNTIAAVDWNGADLESGGQVLAQGYTFYSSPRLSPDGSRLVWLCWNHPNMPWDGTELWLAEVQADGSISQPRQIAGGKRESIFQPEWSPEGRLYFISDRSGWWNLYRWEEGEARPLHPAEAEFGQPQWVFGMRTYTFESARRLVCTYFSGGRSTLAVLDTESLDFQPVDLDYTEFSGLRAGPGCVFFVGASPTQSAALLRLDLDTQSCEILRRTNDLELDPNYISIPEEIEFPTENGLTAFAYYYPPRNGDFIAPEGEQPPLLVESHGGPTGQTSNSLSLEYQFWTSRGFAILDVNYGGSTGYGRAYRERLNDNWGVVDMDDCVNGALYLARSGRVDANRMAIRGGSAGGYTTLCALTFRNVFKAGASYYGISDMETMAQDTHKFESRYLDNLIGPYPEARQRYIERSPIHFIDQINCPMILLQGSEDQVVPPEQSRRMFEAVRSKQLPVAYLEFEGEQHGFRQSQNIKRSMEAELYFYSRIFGFELAGSIEPVHIENLP